LKNTDTAYGNYTEPPSTAAAAIAAFTPVVSKNAACAGGVVILNLEN
jgi:hypothetical protein